jgi:cytoskeletal protein CcmA (bactofilin family)
MADNFLPADFNSIIGEGTRLGGEFDIDGLLRIDGDFSGIVKSKSKVLIGRNGRAECKIYAGTVVIGGIMKGDIYATEKVEILSTGIILGNIKTPRLIMHEGVIFHGDCKVQKVDLDNTEIGKQAAFLDDGEIQNGVVSDKENNENIKQAKLSTVLKSQHNP